MKQTHLGRQWRTALCVVSLSVVFLFCACENEAYESGDMSYSNMRADFVEAYSGQAEELKSMVTDDGDSLALKTDESFKWVITPDSVYRALIYYNKVKSGEAEVIIAKQVPTAHVVPAWSVKEIKADPVQLASSWKSSNGRYINLGINLLTGKEGDETIYHEVGVVCDTLMQHEGGLQHLHLRLYHNQNNAPEYYTSRNYLSIPLKKSPYHLGKGDTISIVVNTYDGEVCKQFFY